MRSRLSNPLCAAVVMIGAVWLQPAAAAVDTGEAASFLADLQERAASQLGDASISAQEKEEHFRKLFNENFDVPRIGQFVIGRYWRAASEADQKAFLAVLEDAMVQSFLPLLEENSSESLQNGPVTTESAKIGRAHV